MAMIIIFNAMTDKLVDNAEGELAPVLPVGSMILTLEYPDGTIERLGRNWRVTHHHAPEPLTGQQAQVLTQQLIDRWLGLTGKVIVTTSDEQGYRVVVWLAAEQEPRRLWIQPMAGLITDILSQTTWQIDFATLTQLPLESLKES